ncbi:hypothetical protein AB3N02_22150 [Priestia aryabhattai]|uniref:hypothetical protein n=1 Tax=Priestia aryabhattai TaxID=412384 RepID=UPI0039A11BC3
MKHLEGLNAIVNTGRETIKGTIKHVFRYRMYILVDGMLHGFNPAKIESMKVYFKNGIVEYK